jgi:hypothetical protein
MSTQKFEIGRSVVYIPTKETGIVTSKNESFVFVRYGDEMHSKATRPENLKNNF